MKNFGRILFAVGCLLVLAAVWPILPLANRIAPFIFGLPFLVFYVLCLNFAVTIFLWVASRYTE